MGWKLLTNADGNLVGDATDFSFPALGGGKLRAIHDDFPGSGLIYVDLGIWTCPAFTGYPSFPKRFFVMEPDGNGGYIWKDFPGGHSHPLFIATLVDGEDGYYYLTVTADSVCGFSPTGYTENVIYRKATGSVYGTWDFVSVTPTLLGVCCTVIPATVTTSDTLPPCCGYRQARQCIGDGLTLVYADPNDAEHPITFGVAYPFVLAGITFCVYFDEDDPLTCAPTNPAYILVPMAEDETTCDDPICTTINYYLQAYACPDDDTDGGPLDEWFPVGAIADPTKDYFDGTFCVEFPDPPSLTPGTISLGGVTPYDDCAGCVTDNPIGDNVNCDNEPPYKIIIKGVTVCTGCVFDGINFFRIISPGTYNASFNVATRTGSLSIPEQVKVRSGAGACPGDDSGTHESFFLDWYIPAFNGDTGFVSIYTGNSYILALFILTCVDNKVVCTDASGGLCWQIDAAHLGHGGKCFVK